MGTSSARPEKIDDVNVAPGQYDDGVRFNSSTKAFKIGEKRYEHIHESVGPGAYAPERAEALTKHKTPNVHISSSPARPASFAKGGDVDIAPGQYNHEKKFGADTKSFKIGEKRERYQQTTVGPGEYEPTKAEGITRHKSPNVNMS